LAPSELEKKAWSLEPPVRAKLKVPLPVMLFFRSYSTQLPVLTAPRLDRIAVPIAGFVF